MTKSGRLVALVVIFSLILAVVIRSPAAMASAFAVAFFLTADGGLLFFGLRSSKRLRIRRRFGSSENHAFCVCGKAIENRIELFNPTKYNLKVEIKDLTPPGIKLEGKPSFRGELPPFKTVPLSYTVRGEHFATFRFQGILVSFSSPGGLWLSKRFLELPGRLRIVPDVSLTHSLPHWPKGQNVLLRHGNHRQQKPGLGAELLSLRSYQEGDPLKSIAWRASARKDRLLTKEFQNEVPVRVRLIFQGSLRFHLGEKPASQHTATCLARIAKLVCKNRDLVELIASSPGGLHRTGLGLTQRHLGRILAALGEVISEKPVFPGVPSAEELEEVYRRALFFEPGLKEAARILAQRRFRISLSRHSQKEAVKLVSVFLSYHFNLGIGAVALLENNHELLGYFARKFAAHTDGLYPSLTVNALSWALAEGPEAGSSLCRRLSYLISHARDEELFVVLSDFSILPQKQKEQLIKTIKGGRAYGHKFVVIWPAIPWKQEELKDQIFNSKAGKRAQRAQLNSLCSLAETIEESTSSFQRRLRSSGVPSCSLRSEEGFLPVLKQLKLLHTRKRVPSW